MAKRKLVRISFIDDGDELTDDAVLEGLKRAKKNRQREEEAKTPVQEKKAHLGNVAGALEILRGGPGSGNFGHKGRKGKRGGSSRGGGTSVRVSQARKRVQEAKKTFMAETNKWRGIDKEQKRLAGREQSRFRKQRQEADFLRHAQTDVDSAARRKEAAERQTGWVPPGVQEEYDRAVLRRDKQAANTQQAEQEWKDAKDARRKFAEEKGIPISPTSGVIEDHPQNMLNKVTDDFHDVTWGDRRTLMDSAKMEAAEVRKNLPEFEAQRVKIVEDIEVKELALVDKKKELLARYEPLMGFDTPEKHHLVNEIKQADAELRHLAQERRVMLRENSAKQRELVKVDNPANPKYEVDTFDRADQFDKRSWAEGREEFNQLVGTGTIDGVTFEIERIPRDEVDRANYETKGVQNVGRVNMDSTGNSAVIVHELGHGLEAHDPFIDKEADNFLARRTMGEQPKPLSNLTGKEYRSDEKAYEDDFSDPYMGKVYKDGSTEIISMGLEKMYRSAAEFAREDPEYFDFIYSISRSA